MDAAVLLRACLDSSDTIAQVAASLYIAIAIFSGEQVATAFKGQQPHIRINPRRYIRYLNLWPASGLLIGLALLGHLYPALMPADGASQTYTWGVTLGGCFVFAALLGGLAYITYDTLVHRSIEKRFKRITGSVSRLLAWALQSEKDETERLKLISILLERTNDTDLERFMLEEITASLKRLLAHPRPAGRAALLGTLRTLHANLAKRPIEHVAYFEQLFALSHEQWWHAVQRRSELHAHKVFQIGGSLSTTAAGLMRLSLDGNQLAYDYFQLLVPFLEEHPDAADEYFKRIAPDLMKRIIASPQYDLIRDDYASAWRIRTDTPLSRQPAATRALLHQFAVLAKKAQRQPDVFGADMDAATVFLFGGEGDSWQDIVRSGIRTLAKKEPAKDLQILQSLI